MGQPSTTGRSVEEDQTLKSSYCVQEDQTRKSPYCVQDGQTGKSPYCEQENCMTRLRVGVRQGEVGAESDLNFTSTNLKISKRARSL